MASEVFFQERASMLWRAALRSRTDAARQALMGIAQRFGELALTAERPESPPCPDQRAAGPG